MSRQKAEVKSPVLLRSASEWIELAKKKIGARKDSDIARALGTTKQAICNYQSSRNGIGAKEAIRLGWLIEKDPVEIIITSAVHATQDRQREQWIKILEDYQIKITAQGGGESEQEELDQQQAEKRPN